MISNAHEIKWTLNASSETELHNELTLGLDGVAMQ